VRANDDLEHNQRYDDRYNGEFTIIGATTRTCRIFLQEIINVPALRRMDVSRMTSLVIFESQTRGVHSIDVSEIALEH
jgi:hypothetical protein